ncbi:MAG: purine-nucleoside phosphorylase, partial [Planctomycetota bacterium]
MSEWRTRAELQRIVDAVRARCGLQPRIAILLGTGLGGLAERLEAEVRLPYAEIGMPRTSVESHAGELILGRLGGQAVVAFSGRLHLYEGHDAAAVVVPVRVARLLGAEVLMMGSAVGGMHPQHELGDLVLIDDHINLMDANPLIGPNDDAIGPRWPDMIEPYDRDLQDLAMRTALERGIRLQKGVYVGVSGPNLETRAEYRMLRMLGADV